MGYSTDFSGFIEITPKITEAHAEYINKFTENRRQKWNMSVEKREDPLRIAVDLPVGIEGEFFTGATGGNFNCCGQESSSDVLDSNRPPATQPGLWCQWEINEDGDLVWDGGEKFYEYVEWLQYMIDNFFKRWGYVLNGSIEWSGEDRDDLGCIDVKDNVVTTLRGQVIYE